MPETSAINPPTCPYCGHLHKNVCSMVKAIEYYPDGSTKRIELKTAKDYDQTIVQVPSVFSGCGDDPNRPQTT